MKLTKETLEGLSNDWNEDMRFGFDSVEEYVEYEFSYANLSKKEFDKAVAYVKQNEIF